MGYLAPADVPISSSWQDHKNRNPPSGEPGTDYATAYGVDLVMAETGTVSVVKTSPSGGDGRRLSIDLDDGRRVSYLHLDRIAAYVGMRVTRGQRGVAFSGASGNGSSNWYGPHVHVSLWQRPGMAWADTIDFAAYVDPPPPPPEEKDMDMTFSIAPLSDGHIYCVSLITGLRVRINSPYHVTLLQRLKVNNSNDNMLTGEVDICQSYLAAVNPEAIPHEVRRGRMPHAEEPHDDDADDVEQNA